VVTPPEDRPAFAIGVEPGDPVDPSLRRDADRSVLGLRERAEYFYTKWKELQQEVTGELKAQAKRELKFLLDMIRVADSFEDVLGMYGQPRRWWQRKPEGTMEAFQTTYELLKEKLEAQGVHPVEILGKGYQDVNFEGITIPEPWKVIGAGAEANGEGGAAGKVVRKVVRTLWVRKKGKKLQVLRRQAKRSE